MQPGAYADPHTPSARGWSQRARGLRSGIHAPWLGTMASGQPQHVSRSVAIRLRPAGAGAMRMATHRGALPRPCVPGSAACSWQAGHRRRGSLAGGRSPAVDRCRRTPTLPVLPRRPMRRLTDAVLRPPWWPQRPLPRAGSPLVRPAGVTRRPTGGVGTGNFSLQLSPQNRKGRMCRIRSLIWLSISCPFACLYIVYYQGDSALISQMSAVISGSLQMERLI
jgi:hypothetical protein